MTRETLLLIATQSAILFVALWALFKLIPSIPANAKAWMWRLAFLKPLLSLMPFAVITLKVLPAPQASAELPPAFVDGSAPVNITPVLDSAPSVQEPVAPPTDPILAAWYVGVFLVAGYGVLGIRRSLKTVAQAEPVTSPDVLETLSELLERGNVTRSVRLLVSDRVHSAMLVGGRGYSIVLPAKAMEDRFQDLRLMLAHEVAHIARRDLTWFGVTSVVQTLFFFNPMVWIAARCSRLDHESATDRYASDLAGVPIQTYAAMLVRATVVAKQLPAPGSLPVAESYRTLHRRLEAMKHFNSKPTLWRRTATAALSMLTLSLLPAYQLASAVPLDYLDQEPGIPGQAVAAGGAPSRGAAKPAKPAKPQTATQYATLPLKVTKGKNGKTRYFVYTKKGYVEIAKPAPLKTQVSAAARPGGGAVAGMGAISGQAGNAAVAGFSVPSQATGGAGFSGKAVAGQGRAGTPASGTGAQPAGVAGGGVRAGIPSSGGHGLQGAAGFGGEGIGGDGGRPGQGSAIGAPAGFGGGGQGVPASTGFGGGTVAGSGGSGFGGDIPSASGPGQGSPERAKSIDFDDMEARTAFVTIFKAFGKSYVLSPDVKGKVTLHLENVTFEQVFEGVLRASNTTYRVEKGVYYVTPKGAPAPKTDDTKVSVQFHEMEVRKALQALFKDANKNGSFDSGLKGVITCNLEKVSFEEALHAILKQANATYRVEGNVYYIIPR